MFGAFEQIFAVNRPRHRKRPRSGERHPGSGRRRATLLIDCFIIGILVLAVWNSGDPKVGSEGSDEATIIYCGYKPDGHGGSDYVCVREPATKL
jgi:hypothetical protein